MTAQHTPGPWVFNDTHYTDSAVVTDSRGLEIANAYHMPILLGYAEKLNIQHWADKPGEAYIELEPAEQEANARLIAAAPELLRALREIACSYPATEEGEVLAGIARDAVIKATGEKK